MTTQTISRREFVKLSAAAAAGLTILPGFRFGLDQLPAPAKRMFGKTGFEVTTLGLGGQASIQWTPEDVDPVPIILKALKWESTTLILQTSTWEVSSTSGKHSGC